MLVAGKPGGQGDEELRFLDLPKGWKGSPWFSTPGFFQFLPWFSRVLEKVVWFFVLEKVKRPRKLMETPGCGCCCCRPYLGAISFIPGLWKEKSSFLKHLPNCHDAKKFSPERVSLWSFRGWGPPRGWNFLTTVEKAVRSIENHLLLMQLGGASWKHPAAFLLCSDPQGTPFRF